MPSASAAVYASLTQSLHAQTRLLKAVQYTLMRLLAQVTKLCATLAHLHPPVPS